MASWLKAAEGVIEEQSWLSVNWQKINLNLSYKAQKRNATTKSPKPSDTLSEQTTSEVLQSDVEPDKDKGTLSSENDGKPIAKSMVQTSSEQESNIEKDIPGVPSSEPLEIDVVKVKHDADQEEISANVSNGEASLSTSNGELLNENAPAHAEQPPSPLATKEIEVVTEDNSKDGSQKVESESADVPSKNDKERSQPVVADSPVNNEAQLKEDDTKIETPVSQKKPIEQKTDTPPTIVQDHLDEAQGLLKTTNSTGQSKEARLARVCAGLSSRLQEYKSENAQLEELLVAERELSKSYEARIKQLQQELSESKSEVTRVESSMVEALAAKNSEIEALVNSMDALKKQAALSEGNLASLQANMESIMRNRELTETRMMQALREELASAERRAEEERAAHNATKMAAMEREVELEHRAVEASTALARIQRVADERTTKAAELEHRVALLEVECASLNQELQDMEARVRRGQKKSPDEANQMIQMQAWQEEVERARQGQRDAESKLSSLEAEVQKMRVEMAAMKRDAEHYSRQEHMELEKRYRELTDLLYYKQTQLETMASEKAAAEFQLEKELKRLQEAQVEVERSRVPRRASNSWEEDTEIKALEPLPLHHRHMAAASIQLQKAAKLLDSGAVRATRFLWRYPTARIILLFYLVFVHLFLMYLLHRLQEQADSLAARELAESMGLANPNLP
ncbi:putative Golgin-84 [Corchorus capsularis]|uniref:Putative Golgin-84 n=1 Tax=Corchorus capsularis TaxID=210143 RepID=A0A1R3IJA0_COCAP|nr:putative Golgin-84 [Corchorus capsularis]